MSLELVREIWKARRQMDDNRGTELCKSATEHHKKILNDGLTQKHCLMESHWATWKPHCQYNNTLSFPFVSLFLFKPLRAANVIQDRPPSPKMLWFQSMSHPHRSQPLRTRPLSTKLKVVCLVCVQIRWWPGNTNTLFYWITLISFA